MNKKETVCAVVVTYNRKNLLIECLEALRKQTRPIQAMYIIDNFSSDGTPDTLKEHRYILELPPSNLTEPWEKEFEIQNLTDGEIIKVHYVRMNENTGGAGGFYEGVKRGFEKGYDWLWLMDDDTEPVTDCLQLLLTYDSSRIGILCPLILGYDGYQLYHHKVITRIFLREKSIARNVETIPETTKIDANAFVGPLIKSKYIEKVGFPQKELFIWGDDTEYTYRISKNSDILLCKNAIIKHKNAFNNKTISVEKLKREVYMYRNKILFVKRFGFYNVFAYIYWILQACKASTKIVLRHKSFSASLYPLKGIVNGFLVKF